MRLGAIGYSTQSTPPYFIPDPDVYSTYTPAGAQSPSQVDSMESYLQKFIVQCVSDMYGFVSGTQGWANGGTQVITQNFIQMAQQRCAFYSGICSGIDPVALGTKYANVFMQILASVPVSRFGATSFTGSILDFLNAGGSPPPTVLNQVPPVLANPQNTLNNVAPIPVTVTPQPPTTQLTPPTPMPPITPTQITNGNPGAYSYGTVPAPSSGSSSLSGVESWITQNWMILAAGVAALVILPSLGGKR